MDRNEYNFKIEEMRVAVRNKDYERAVQIADSLDYRREKANDILSLIADAYEMAKQYDKAKQALIIAYENTNTGRHLAYRLCLLSAKLQQFDEAEEFYQDFVELAPRDNDKYILQYEMQKAKKAPIGKLIEILEKYIQEDMEEKWAYELAKLYHEAGDEENCVDMCDEISLWFAEGKYVNKAMELKKLYRPLTKLQQERYDNYRLGRKPLQKIEKDERKENKQAGDIEDNLSIDNAISEDKEKESVSVKIADEVIDERPSIPFMIRKDNFKESIRKLKHPVIESIHKSNDEKKAEGESEQKELFAQQNNPDVQEIFVEQNDPEMHEITFEDEFEKDELELESEENSESEENPEVNKNLESEENLESKENEFIVDEANIEESSKEKSDYSAKEATDESDGKLDVEKIAVESDSTENNVDKEAETILDGKENVDAIQENDSDEKSLSEEDNASNNESITDDEEDQIVKKQNTGQLSIEEVLHKLQDRGILKADTVEKAVKALDEAENIVEKTEEDFEKINPDYKRIQSIHEGLGIDEEGNEQEIEDTETYNYDNEQYFDEIEISNQGKEIQHAGVSEFENPTHDKELGADHEKELDMVQRGLESFAAEAAADVFVPDVDTDVIEEEIKFQTGEISFGTMDLNEIVNQSAAPERHNEKRINVSSNDISDTVQLEKHTSSIPNMDNEMTEITLDPIDFEKTDNIEKSPETNEIPNFDIEALEDTETAGEFEGKTLSWVYENHRELFGNIQDNIFPLLVKIIGAEDDLSIQVHPNDEYAAVHENGSLGKTECWYILDCKEDANIVIGHHAKDKKELADMIHEGRWNELIRTIPIKKGDFFQINPGCLHAIKGGTLLIETQQSSDITYRVYDYDRLSNGKPRELHVQQSIDCIEAPHHDYDGKITVENEGDLTKTTLVKCDFYTLEKWDVAGKYKFTMDKPFMNISVINGEGEINGSKITKGNHFIIPSGIGECKISGDLTVMASYL